MNNLKQVLENLKSDKVKERQEGLASIRKVFARDEVVANFYVSKGKCDPRMWLPVFQALFAAVLNEKIASTKKATTKSAGPSAVALRRLGEAASVVRWLTERTVLYMNRRVTTALCEHFVQTMVHKGELLSPVALDYAKAIRCLLSYKPHLDSLEDQLWVKMVEMGFNTVLGDPVKARFEDDSSASEALEAPAPDVDSDMYMDDDEDGDRDQLPVAVTQSRKRRRRETTSIPGPSTLKAKPRANRSQPISLEQVEWASILSILLRSSTAPILCTAYPHLASSILVRLRRFLELYPADSSLLHDYIMILFYTLRHLSLNKKMEVENFAREAWDGLVGLWGTKDKSMKEGLVVVLRILFPFVTADGDVGIPSRVSFDCSDSIGRLWSVLDGEAESRWGVDGLSLDAIRLEPVIKSANDTQENKAFVVGTFRAGWNFDASQALAWAILELQADCAGKLFLLSESMHSSSTPGTLRGESKRVRLENPVASILSRIRIQQAPNVRSYYLQILLFFVDRHWSSLHLSLKEDIINTLLQLVSVDDNAVQSWVFINFAAIAYEEGSKTSSPSIPSVTWDSIWTHAIRRASVSGVCRAACHAGHVLIVSLYSQSGASTYMLTSQRVLLEIESLAKDMDVQGPSYPYDSTCMFLAQCLRIASQDVRLYRMQLEEKVQTWLVDSWKIVGADKGKMAFHMVGDALLLLESICGLGKRCDLTSRILLPDCLVVDAVVYEDRTRVIRDFLLRARLPSFKKPVAKMQDQLQGSDLRTISEESQEQYKVDVQNPLIQPRGRERKMSAFLLKTLDTLLSEWFILTNNQGYPTAEMARQSLDIAVISLAFESVLLLKGTTPNRRVLQSAVKIVSLVTPLLKDPRWSPPEKALILVGLEPLVSFGPRLEDGYYWEALPCPDIGSGIRTQSLKELIADISSVRKNAKGKRIGFLRIIWQNADVRDVLADAIVCMRDVLRIAAGETPINTSNQPMDVDDMDDFAPIRTSVTHRAADTSRQTEDSNSSRCLVEVCTAFISVGPLLQSESGESTRDKDLTEIILGCAEFRQERFILLCQAFLDEARRKTLQLTIKDVDKLLQAVSSMLASYTHSRSQHMQLLLIHLLDSTLDVWWTARGIPETVEEKVVELCHWLSRALRKQKIPSWRTRDRLACFLDRYLAYDPSQTAWPVEEGPTTLLPMMGSDEDIRVRFRVAFLNAHLLSVTCRVKEDPTTVYGTIRAFCTNDMDNYEHMLTRLLSFGNAMIISSAVRRGSYWNLLEICIDKTEYDLHIEAILTGVSERLGLTKLSDLCEAYASQLAFSIQKRSNDFFRFPPHLLGYRDRKQYAEATFRAFTPTYILTNRNKLFESHCKVIQKSPDVGLRECFGDIVGFSIIQWFNDNQSEDGPEVLEQILKETTSFQGDLFEKLLNENSDNITSFMLGTLQDHDSVPIIAALRDCDPTGNSAETFELLIKYRHLGRFETHVPNLPAYPAEFILRGLAWLASRLPDSITAATTYHVLHELLAQLERSPFLNEQLRLVNALSLWISLRSQDFEDDTLLYTLVHGATSFLAQLDLVRSAQSVLEWAFVYYTKPNVDATRLPNILVRISCLAYDYASNRQDCSTAEIGRDLLTWVDEQVLALSKVSRLKEMVLRALPAWPHHPSSDLSRFYNDISLESLSSVLSDQRITSNKFRLVRRLRDHTMSEVTDDDGDFAKRDFWRLRECIPSMDRLQDDDIDAFASLLIIHHGQIASFPGEQPKPYSIRERHKQKNRKTTPGAEETASAPNCVLLALLEMLEGDVVSQVYSAYNTLRLIMSVSSSERMIWPRGYKKELQYLQRYCRPPKSVDPKNLRDSLASDIYIDATRDFPVWVSMIASLLSNVLASSDPIFAQLDSILHSDTTFAEEILPILVHTLLREGQNAKNDHRTLLSQYFTSVLSADHASLLCRRLIVDIVLHLRYFARTQDPLSCDTWLEIDFTLLAKSAIACGAYTTALLFLELAAEHQVDSRDESTAEQVFYEIYAHIDEPDGFYGIQTNDLRQFLIKRFHHEKQWEKAFRFHGAALESGNPPSGETEGLLKSFHSFGFDHLAIDTLRSTQGSKNSLEASSSMSYRLGWRTETWDLPECEEQAPGASLYHSLRATYRERDSHVIDAIVRRSLNREINRLRELGSENVAEIREAAQDLMCLNQLSQWRLDPIQTRLKSRRIELDHWSDFVKIDSRFEFSDLENIMATRISLIRSVRQLEERQQIGTLVTPFAQGLINVEKQSLLRLSEAAREANQVQIALNSVIRAQRLEKEPSFDVSQEFANVLWLQKEEKLAVQFLQSLVRNLDNTADLHEPASSVEKALLLARLGTWTSEACLQKPTDIWTHYFNRAISILDETDTMTHEHDSHASVYRECAMFAERQYHVILKSPDAMRWKVYVDRKKKEIEQRQEELRRTQEGSSRQSTLKSEQVKAARILQEDSELYNRHILARDTFLKQAVDMYSRCLQTSDAFDRDSAIRFCSLWFANFENDLVLGGTLPSALARIPSRKLVFLSHQLTARLAKLGATSTPKNQESLQNLVIRMCHEHPFHSLYQVYCLRPSSVSTAPPGRRQPGRHATSAQTERAEAASEIFDRLRGDEANAQRVLDVERLCDACLQWAKYPIKGDKRFNGKAAYEIPTSLLIRQISNLKVPVATCKTPLDPTMLYKDCVWIKGYEATFQTVGGVNIPKITVCEGSDGGQYRQLFKGEGNDDLRQDAVMEQVFELVNDVLHRDRETRRRELRVRDYKVIPLDSQAGFMEFVGNTTTLRTWLMKAHRKFRPTDLTPEKCAAIIGQSHGKGAEKQLAAFQHIRKKFHPVMRHYFTEKHKTPMSWFSMRLTYTRSVATTSIVGHVLGLGDRHTSNILIDFVNGEVVHIDLGIAFDQGKLLTVPERVPFRMTADMVDGMGITGTQGVFQRCAEETLRVLRDGSEVIMTVLEVFKHDPLHAWAASEVRIKRAQDVAVPSTISDTNMLGGLGIGIDMSSGSAEEAADRALNSVARKLDKSLSVESTVNELIAEATDTLNLATIYHGWGPQY